MVGDEGVGCVGKWSWIGIFRLRYGKVLVTLYTAEGLGKK